jgi:nitroimidazol reductase NimA-like FMN-containing flavoprotein (pyridoxamine 5'-phosphate oxidase superfamily)
VEQPSEGARQHDIEPGDCLLLLATQQVGRLVTAGSPPRVRPVNFVVVDGSIYLRTDDEVGADEPLAFEVDHLDASERQGWSVIVKGRARTTAAEDVPTDARQQLLTWAPGDKLVWSVIEIEAITGTWVRAGRARPNHDRRGYL